jgi:hypothetical protein
MMKTSSSFFTGLWTKMMMTPGMATSFLPRKKVPRLLLQTTIQQQEGTFVADRHFQKLAKIPRMIPAVAAMPAMIVAALVATMATATTTPAFLPHTNTARP